MNPDTSVLFVCMGNICRSPAAEAIFRSKVKQAGLTDRIHIDSAGTIGYHAGAPADRRMRDAGAKRGYDLDSRSRQIKLSDFEDFDHILAMDYENLSHLESMSAKATGSAKIRLMCEYATRHGEREVPDPYYGGNSGFELVMDLLEDACGGLLRELQENGQLNP